MTTPVGIVLNVGLDPRVVETANGVGPAQIRAGLDAAAAELAGMGLAFENCLLDRSPGAEELLRTALGRKRYDVIVFGGGVRLDPAMTPLFEKLVNIARVHAPDTVLCFNTGPTTTAETVRRWWPPTPMRTIEH